MTMSSRATSRRASTCAEDADKPVSRALDPKIGRDTRRRDARSTRATRRRCRARNAVDERCDGDGETARRRDGERERESARSVTIATDLRRTDDAGERARVSTTMRDARRERTTDEWMCASSAAQDGSHGGDGPTEEDGSNSDVIIHYGYCPWTLWRIVRRHRERCPGVVRTGD